MNTLGPNLDTARTRLEGIGQDHLLQGADALRPDQLDALLAQIEALDTDKLPGWIEKYVAGEHVFQAPADLAPAPCYPADPTSDRRPWDREAARARGEALLREGKVACFTVAGGQGSRLGYDGPKGCFPVGSVSDKPLFRIFAEGVLATSRRYAAPVPWYIMTSPLNHDATVAFFEAHEYFGLPRADVAFFPQGSMPSLDRQTGRILMSAPGVIATNPDGHGGAIRALWESGSVDDMKRRGVEHLSYFQVDNPLARVADPVFLGLHAGAEDSSGEFSSKMVAKTDPGEKVGVFCSVGGRTEVIEYSDLPAELASKTREDGSILFEAGNIAIHAIGVPFIERLATDPSFELTFHRAIKKVAHVDPKSGERVEPSEPNAVKLERFIFDAIPLAERSIVFETRRVEEFAPVKNAEGVDSVVSSKRIQTQRAADWLERAGVSVPRTAEGEPDCVLEIGPLFALDAEHLAERRDLPDRIEPGARVLLDES
jgi:UDP-N-acetylglucosamine/UDP-N-acetylgalactosamine diphosphorylase